MSNANRPFQGCCPYIPIPKPPKQTIIGPRGPRGPVGPEGPAGPQGPSGTPVLSGVGDPSCATGNLGDLYIDQASGDTFYKMSQPVPPSVRPIPEPTGTTINVGSTRTYTTITAALAVAKPGDRLLLDAETFNITVPQSGNNGINVTVPVTIEGQGIGSTNVVTTNQTIYYLFNVTASNVIFKNLTMRQNFAAATVSVESVIRVNNMNAVGIYVDNCEIGTAEFGIAFTVTEFQVTNCSFIYTGPAGNSYRYIGIAFTSGQSIIHNNTFVSASGNTQSRFVEITNVTSPLRGTLVVSDNEQLTSPNTLRHLIDFEGAIGTNFELYILNNTTINEGNVPVLLFASDLNVFPFIAAYGNNIQNTAGKGLIGIDGGYVGTTDIFGSGNSFVNQTFTTGWASATNPTSPIVGYRATVSGQVYQVNPNLPLNPCYWLLLS